MTSADWRTIRPAKEKCLKEQQQGDRIIWATKEPKIENNGPKLSPNAIPKALNGYIFIFGQIHYYKILGDFGCVDVMFSFFRLSSRAALLKVANIAEDLGSNSE